MDLPDGQNLHQNHGTREEEQPSSSQSQSQFQIEQLQEQHQQQIQQLQLEHQQQIRQLQLEHQQQIQQLQLEHQQQIQQFAKNSHQQFQFPVVQNLESQQNQQELPQQDDDLSNNPLCPIQDLSPYHQTWTIKARCIEKTPIRTWKNERSSGRVATVDLLDKQGGQIRAFLWKDEIDKFYDLFEQDQVYFISKGRVKPVSGRTCSILNANYDLHLENSSIVQPAPGDNAIAPIEYHFRTIGDIENLPNDTIVNLFGIILEVDTKVLQTKSGKEVQRQKISLGDRSRKSIDLSLWNPFVNADYKNRIGSVLAVKGVRVMDYFGAKSLSSIFSSNLQLNPDLAECHKLKKWNESQGNRASAQLSFNQTSSKIGGGVGETETRGFEMKSIAQMKSESLLEPEKPGYYFVRGTIVSFRKDGIVYYTACPQCQKRVYKMGQDWYCERCCQSLKTPQYRYILSCVICDRTGSQAITIFDEIAEELLGVPASQLSEWKEGMTDHYFAAFEGASFRTYNFRIRAIQSSDIQGKLQMRCSVVRATPVDFVRDTTPIINELIVLSGR